jgi:multidrug efflux pump subunit AcrB
MLNVNVADVFGALQTFLGSTYVNDFNLLGRTFRVVAQADAPFRLDTRDVLKIRVRNSTGQTVPLGSFTTAHSVTGSFRVPRHNLYPAAELDASPLPGTSQGQVIDALQNLAKETLPEGIGYEWTTLAFQQLRAGSTAIFAFILAVIFVFLVLAAQYESWSIPFAVLLGVPFGALGALLGIWIRGSPSDIYFQVGLITVVGLAAKNAILIVEFANEIRTRGTSLIAAAVEAARERFRPILMTSFAFILGVSPLVIASGAGAGSRHSLGTGVFAGMLFATSIGIFFIPLFFRVIRGLAEGRETRRAGAAEPLPTPASPEAR